MDKDLEKLSALYDGELSSKEIQEGLANMNADEDLKNTFQKFGLISDLVQRHSEKKTSKVSFLKSKISPFPTLSSTLFDIEVILLNLLPI